MEGVLNNWQDFSQSLVLCWVHPDHTMVIHCASGKRSARALPVLREQKQPALYHMDGGLKAWKDAGLPVEAAGA